MKFQVNTGRSQKFKVSASGRVAIGTDSFSSNKLIVSGDTSSTGGGVALTHSLVVGKTTRECAVDFSDAGKNLTGAGANKMFMVPPKLTDAEQTAITNAGVVSGAVIYNTTDNKLRVYNGTAWRDLQLMTIKNSGPGPNPNPLSFSEIEAEFGSGGGQRRLGKYRRDDPAFQNEGPFSNADNGMLGKRPLDDGIPTGANATIKFSDFYSKKLNMIIKYYGGSAQNRTGTGGGNDNNQIATWKYHNEETNVIVVGNFKDRPAGSYDASGNTFDSSNWQGGKKVIIHVNKRIGSENSPNDQSYNRRKCALRTGRWPSGTDLRLDVGSSGQILGAGGDGRKGSSGNSRPAKAQGGHKCIRSTICSSY